MGDEKNFSYCQGGFLWSVLVNMGPCQHSPCMHEGSSPCWAGFPNALNLVKHRETPSQHSESRRCKPFAMGSATCLLRSWTLSWVIWSLLEKGMPSCPMRPFRNLFCHTQVLAVQVPEREQTSPSACLLPLQQPALGKQTRNGVFPCHGYPRPCQPHTSEGHNMAKGSSSLQSS